VALWNLEALIEKRLATPFADDHAERSEAARAQLLAV
jgi:hypothetical protein